MTAPTELRVWNWLSLGLLALFIGLGTVTRSRWVAAAVLVAGGIVQAFFGSLTTANRGKLAERLARHYAARPVLLGGFIANRYTLSWRLQGAFMVLVGIGLIAAAVMLVR